MIQSAYLVDASAHFLRVSAPGHENHALGSWDVPFALGWGQSFRHDAQNCRGERLPPFAGMRSGLGSVTTNLSSTDESPPTS